MYGSRGLVSSTANQGGRELMFSGNQLERKECGGLKTERQRNQDRGGKGHQRRYQVRARGMEAREPERDNYKRLNYASQEKSSR